MSILATTPDLEKIINKAVKRIGENHALARDNKGVEYKASQIEEDRKEFRKGRTNEVGNETMESVIEESLKAVADEMAEKMVLENTIDKMVKDVVNEQRLPSDMPRGCRECLMEAIGNKYKGKARKIISGVMKFMEKGETPTMEEMMDIMEGVSMEDALIIGPKVIKCQKTCDGQRQRYEGEKLDESTTDTIKKLVHKKLKEAKITKKHPGTDAYEKSYKKSGSINNTAIKDAKKKFKEYETFEGNENPEFPHQEMSKTNADGQYQYYRNTEDDQEFVDDFAYPGLIDFDIHNVNMDRLTKYLEGSSETGNAQTDKDGEALGNVVPSELGEKMLKSMKRRKEKIADQKASMSNLRGYTPDVQKVKQVKEGVNKDMDTMKKLWSYNKKTQ